MTRNKKPFNQRDKKKLKKIRCREILTDDPDITDTTLAKRLKCCHGTIAGWRKEFKEEKEKPDWQRVGENAERPDYKG